MLLISFFRAIKFSLQDTYRNIWLSLVTVTILVLALFSVNILLVVKFISDASIDSIKEKIDINIFIDPLAKEEDILALKARISNIKEVKEVNYISQGEALATFKEKHKADPNILEALQEVGSNPLSPTLVIKPKDPDRYDSVISSLNSMTDPIIVKKNFDDHRVILKKINNITQKISKAGITLSFIFVLITILLVYNSIRVAIYTHRREIGIMRLVGASHWFIRSPYIISSFNYTLLGIGLVVLLFYPLLNLLQPYIETFFINYEINIVNYFNENFIRIFGLEFLALVCVNMLASVIAVAKYSKV